MEANRLQISVATGRFTLPVVCLVCILLWLFQANSWSEAGSFVIAVLTGYLMIEANVTFLLIRVRTMLPVCIYWFLLAVMGFLHPFQWSHLAVPAFVSAVFSLFYSYDSSHLVFPIFHTFFFLSLGSLVFPQLLYYALPFLFGALVFRSFPVKGFFAALLGLLAPYWLLFGHAFWYGEMQLFYEPFQELFRFYPIDWSEVQMVEWISWGVVIALQTVSSVHYFMVAYQDKTRTRSFLFFWLYIGIFTAVFGLLQPCHLSVLLPLQLICTSFLAAHLFTLTKNRFSSVLFVVTLISFFVLTCFNLWM